MRQRAILILLFIHCAVLPAVAEYRPHTDLTLEIGGHPVVTSDTDKLTRRVMAFSDERVRITVRLFYGVGVTETGKHEGTSVLSFREPWWKLLRWQMQDEYGNVLTFAPQISATMPVGDARLLHEGETREASFELEAGSPGKRRILVTLPVATDDSAVVHAEPVVLEVYHGNESREIHAEYLRTRVRRLISKPGYDFEGVKPLLLELAALTPTDFGPLEWLADLSLGHTSLDETRLLYRRASEILQNETKADSKPPAIIAAYRTAKEQKFAAFERAYAFAHVTTGVQIQLLRQGRREEFVARQDRDGSALRVFD